MNPYDSIIITIAIVQRLRIDTARHVYSHSLRFILILDSRRLVALSRFDLLRVHHQSREWKRIERSAWNIFHAGRERYLLGSGSLLECARMANSTINEANRLNTTRSDERGEDASALHYLIEVFSKTEGS
ncbi:hypothetical protein Trydic_g20981 [Trypoxylus dichotomus]